LVVAVAALVVGVAAVVAEAAAVVADAAAAVVALEPESSSSPQAAAPIRSTTLARPSRVRDDVRFTRRLRSR
jgi:hypothetical protein